MITNFYDININTNIRNKWIRSSDRFLYAEKFEEFFLFKKVGSVETLRLSRNDGFEILMRVWGDSTRLIPLGKDVRKPIVIRNDYFGVLRILNFIYLFVFFYLLQLTVALSLYILNFLKTPNHHTRVETRGFDDLPFVFTAFTPIRRQSLWISKSAAAPILSCEYRVTIPTTTL